MPKQESFAGPADRAPSLTASEKTRYNIGTHATPLVYFKKKDKAFEKCFYDVGGQSFVGHYGLSVDDSSHL